MSAVARRRANGVVAGNGAVVRRFMDGVPAFCPPYANDRV
jgi:hypothetical protein